MEITLTFLGLILGGLGVLSAYIWKANGEMQKKIVTIVEHTSKMVKESIEMHKESIEMHKKGLEILDRMDKRARENHKESMQALKDISQMLLNQTKILERIEGKIK